MTNKAKASASLRSSPMAVTEPEVASSEQNGAGFATSAADDCPCKNKECPSGGIDWMFFEWLLSD